MVIGIGFNYYAVVPQHCSMEIPRRKLLKSTGVAASTGLVGYSTGQVTASRTDGSTAREDQEDWSGDIELALEPASLSQSDRQSVDPIVFSDRSTSEQATLMEAIETASFTDAIGNESPGTQGLREAIEERNDDDPQVFAKVNDAYYSIRFVAGHHIVASPDNSPSNS